MRVAVLHNRVPEAAPLDEADCLVQKAAVSEALAALGHAPSEVEFSPDLASVIQTLESLRPDLVFNLVESLEGNGRLIYTAPAVLDCLGLPYTGCRTEAIVLTSNKLAAKRTLRAAGLPTPAWIGMEDVRGRRDATQGVYIIKSVWEHASVGLDEDSVICVSTAQRLRAELARRARTMGGAWFAETFIDGREFNLSLLDGPRGPRVLPPAEILFEGYPREKPKVVGYRAKWLEGSFEYSHTVRSFRFTARDRPLLRELKELALTCWRIFSLRGYARVDFRVDQDGQPWVLEVNANPCISPDSGFVAAARAAGLGYARTIEKIVQASLAEKTPC